LSTLLNTTVRRITQAKAPTIPSAQPRALDTLVAIVDQAVSFRFAERVPTLADIARVVSASSRVLHIRDLDERISVENAAVMALAKKRNLVN
jgi:hypothetical protein